jgi:hypothetical protein
MYVVTHYTIHLDKPSNAVNTSRLVSTHGELHNDL